MLDFSESAIEVKVENDSKYKLIFSVFRHPFLGVMIHPYVVAYTSLDTLSLTYQKVFSGNASYYSKLSTQELEQIRALDDIMVENIVKIFSPKEKIRPKEYFHKYFTKDELKKSIRPYIEKRITNLFSFLPDDMDSLYVADEINPAAIPITIHKDFTKVLFHFRKNENGTSYFITLKHDDERIPFMKLGGMLLSQNPARILVNRAVYKFYDFVDGSKIGIFINKKFVHIKPENEKIYYTKFVKPLLETAPVFSQGFEIQTLKIEATPVLSLTQKGHSYGFNFHVRYGQKTFPYHGNKLFHVDLDWKNGEPHFTKYKRSKIWEANRVNALSELGLTLDSGPFFRLEKDSLKECISWLRENNEVLTISHFILEAKLNQTYSFEKPNLNYAISDKIDWFDLNVVITVGEFEIPFSKVVAEMKKGNEEIILPNGQIFVFPNEWFALGDALSNQSSRNNLYSVKKYQVDILSLIKSNEIKKHLTKLVDIKKEKPHKLFQGTLRPYQLDGLSWLMFLKNNRFGGILADDMGLGKTVQTLAFLQKLKHQKNLKSPRFLLIAPTSLLFNWKQEAEQFTPDIDIIIHSGAKRAKEVSEFQNTEFIITSYGLIRNDSELFQEIDFEVIMLDESQNIKNHTAKTTQYINKLNTSCRLALTGTPIENTIRDLWSQMNFLNKGLLGSLKVFEERFAKPIEKLGDQKKAEELQSIIKPFLLRRTKNEVAKDLPPIVEKIIYCEMTKEQAEYYEEVKSEYRNSLTDLVDQKGLQKSKFSILQGLSKLRQIANHPYLVNKEFIGQSGKHDILLDKITTALGDGHKVLVFSQFVSYLDILQRDIIKSKLTHFRLTGATSKEKRAKNVKEFQALESPAVFLISLKAGGTGLNLTSADYVFIVDPWWNPAVEAQARDRTHRIGQMRNVFSYKFISRDTIEEKITDLQIKKQGYSKNIIVSENNILSNLDINKLQILLS
ncbi:MAG: helicase SNF2 [Bacteroidetes bacterium]|nr:MAG: helicase SNF2 [Bacteroidota bacterium]